jgi:hypothetical protein
MPSGAQPGKNMKMYIERLVVISLLSVLGTATAATPVAGTSTQNIVTGHYYQVFGDNGISWPAAQTFVLSLPCLNPDGSEDAGCTNPGTSVPHLATITSFDEDEFVESLRAGEKIATTIRRNEIWVGGLQPAGSGTGEDWTWLNGEGSISTSQVSLPSYSNWLSNEPNDAGGSESYLAIGLGGQFGWNDEGNLGNIGGFIVEWDVPLAAEDCVVTPENPMGCVTIVGQTVAFPEDSNPGNATISFNSFEFLDPRVESDPISPDFGKCVTREQLTIFGNTGIGSAPGVRPPMIIPAYLCGSPKFVVVALDSGDLVIETGTVGVENDTATVLPGNVYPDGGVSICEDPIAQVQYSDGDPQYQDIGTWQDTETPTKMVEDVLGGAAGYPGLTGEFTDECGSSRMRVRGGSYFGIGFHIDFGPGYEWVANSAGNFDSFVDLTHYKLTLLKQSIKNARADGATGRFTNFLLRFNVKRAIKRLEQGRYRSALFHTRAIVWIAENFPYNTVADENHNGDHLMRGSNIEFTLSVKIIPYDF